MFLSPSPTNPSWQSIGQQTFVLGEAASLYVWVIPDVGETLHGISLSLAASAPGGLFVVSHEILQPPLSGDSLRWDAYTVQNPQTLNPPAPVGTPGGVLNQSQYLFRDWNAAALINDTPIPGFTPSLGLSAENGGQDPLFNGASGAFLHSQLQLNGVAVGEFGLSLQVGNRGVSTHLQGYDNVRFGNSELPIDGGMAGATDGSIHALLRVVTVLGDTDGDGAVGIADLNNVRNNFGSLGLGDTDGDGLVQISDLNHVRNNFGTSAEMPAGSARLFAVPEPGGLLLASLGSAGIFCFFGWRGSITLVESDTWSGRADYAPVCVKEDHPLMN